MNNSFLNKVKEAKENFWTFVKETPLEYSPRLSKLYGSNIFLKREDLQAVRSYKIRWAFNLINSLSDKEKEAWVVCASAWNHAQWVAITCNKLKIKWTIYMPVTTPSQKVYKTKQFGWEYIEVLLIWDTFDEAFKASKGYEKESGATFVHPFDDERIIEWQATIWLEIYKNFKNDPDYIVCPIWWWWVISWLINITNELNKSTKIIWAEPAWASWMKESLKNWENTTLDSIDIFVDWAAVLREWEKTFNIAKEYNLEVLSCPENRVCSTILSYLHEEWIVVEPAWALATDALKDLKDDIKWKTVVVIISWWNFDFERLPEVKERSIKYEWLKNYYIVTFPQRPWALKDFLKCLWDNDDIERFEYLKKSAKNTAPVFIWIKSNDKKNFKQIEECMNARWFKYKNVTNDELYFDLLI